MKYLKKQLSQIIKKHLFEKKVISLKSNEFSLRKGLSSLGRKAPSPRPMNFLQGRAQVLRETYVLNIFATITISGLFVYRIATYH
jgi:hypothetical protein